MVFMLNMTLNNSNVVGIHGGQRELILIICLRVSHRIGTFVHGALPYYQIGRCLNPSPHPLHPPSKVTGLSDIQKVDAHRGEI